MNNLKRTALMTLGLMMLTSTSLFAQAENRGRPQGQEGMAYREQPAPMHGQMRHHNKGQRGHNRGKGAYFGIHSSEWNALTEQERTQLTAYASELGLNQCAVSDEERQAIRSMSREERMEHRNSPAMQQFRAERATAMNSFWQKAAQEFNVGPLSASRAERYNNCDRTMMGRRSGMQKPYAMQPAVTELSCCSSYHLNSYL